MENKINVLIESKVQTFAEVLYQGKFIIPRYQRPYAWKQDNVKLLLDDIADCISTNQMRHFMGTIMLVPGEKKQWEINDGQQRISTFMLICAHLCKFFYEHGDTSGESHAMQLLFDISKKHTNTLDNANRLSPRVVLSTNDKAAFQSLICGGTVKKNSSMVMAWNTIDDFFADEKYKNVAARKDFFNFMLNNLIVVRIEFKDANDAISVFETLNTKGKPLEQIQLACAYFFKCLKNDKVISETIHDKIDYIRTCLGNDEARFFKYARCSAQCKYGHLSNDRFCRDLKNAISNAKGEFSDVAVYNLVDDLASKHKMEIYHILMRTRSSEEFLEKLIKDARQSNSHRNIMDHLKDLHGYSSVSNSIIFALLVKYVKHAKSKKKAETAKFVCKSVKLLSSFFQRATHSFPGSFNTSQYERGVADIAQKIYHDKCITADDFLAALRELDKNNDIISDSAYKDRMRNINFPSKITDAKYVLGRISEHLQHDVPIVDNRNITEYILPYSKIFAAKWGFDEEEHGRYATRLGNLTLLSPQDNKSAEHNTKFATKRKLYAKSSIPLTQQLPDEYTKWNKDSIEQRQAELAEIAAEVWNFKIK